MNSGTLELYGGVRRPSKLGTLGSWTAFLGPHLPVSKMDIWHHFSFLQNTVSYLRCVKVL
jgi:hypothetical protein